MLAGVAPSLFALVHSSLTRQGQDALQAVYEVQQTGQRWLVGVLMVEQTVMPLHRTGLRPAEIAGALDGSLGDFEGQQEWLRHGYLLPTGTPRQAWSIEGGKLQAFMLATNWALVASDVLMPHAILELVGDLNTSARGMAAALSHGALPGTGMDVDSVRERIRDAEQLVRKLDYLPRMPHDEDFDMLLERIPAKHADIATHHLDMLWSGVKRVFRMYPRFRSVCRLVAGCFAGRLEGTPMRALLSHPMTVREAPACLPVYSVLEPGMENEEVAWDENLIDADEVITTRPKWLWLEFPVLKVVSGVTTRTRKWQRALVMDPFTRSELRALPAPREVHALLRKVLP